MDNLTKKLRAFIKPRMQTYHQTVLDRLANLELTDMLKRKNPYLFRAKALNTAQDIVKPILDAYLSSQEETIFGGVLEELTIFICSEIYNGKKSSTEGIDLEFDKDGIRYIVQIKSGPKWGNSSSIKKMKDNFREAKRILRTNTSGELHITAVNGCCYGKDNRPDKGEYFKYCGQRFWEFISGRESLYIDIIEPLGWDAKKRTEAFLEEYGRVVNRFTLEFGKEYCDDSGVILWEKLVKFNSGKR